PDLILMPGDMCDIDHQEANTLELFQSLSDIPMFYSTGNHEEFRNDLPHLLHAIRRTGVRIPEHNAAVFEKNGSKLEILSLPCYKEMSWFNAREVSGQFHTSGCRILLSHRPEWENLYRDIDCSLVVCGHAHGGQWRIPFLNQGIFAPEQGLFPQKTSGIHNLGNNQMIINRGLVRFYHMTTRMFNNPEISVVEFLPKDSTDAG
ncbi:MAG: hypothetical protein EOM64_07100, partial [Erysipelotrichia bacterium]|nr:hypothetical protein [Erysipelotrichia bacterium]